MQGLIVNTLMGVKNFIIKHRLSIVIFYSGVITILLVFSFFYRPVVVSGSSMLPTLRNNETILIQKNVSVSKIKRGDIIVFRSPLNESKLLIKRVIAIGGDTVAIIDGNVYVNGRLLKERYLNGVKSHETIPLLRVPENSFYVLGDNRVISSDSREFGCVEFKEVYGKLVLAGEKGFNR